jgi:hypothetical protein
MVFPHEIQGFPYRQQTQIMLVCNIGKTGKLARRRDQDEARGAALFGADAVDGLGR